MGSSLDRDIKMGQGAKFFQDHCPTQVLGSCSSHRRQKHRRHRARVMASSTVQSLPSQQPNSNPIPNSLPNPSSRKRALDHAQSSPYFKMRLILKDLRPLFLEVIRAPELQRTEAAHGIQEKMKVMVDLCKQIAMEAPSIVKCNNGSESTNRVRHGEKASEPRLVNQSHAGDEFVKLDKEDGPALGTSIVGGSAFGWNFVTYISSKPEYYGRSKESFMASKPKLEAGEA